MAHRARFGTLSYTTSIDGGIQYYSDILVIPNWQRLVELTSPNSTMQCRILSAPEIELNVLFDRTRDFIERDQFDRIANGCNKETRKKPRLKTSKNCRIFEI